MPISLTFDSVFILLSIHLAVPSQKKQCRCLITLFKTQGVKTNKQKHTRLTNNFYKHFQQASKLPSFKGAEAFGSMNFLSEFLDVGFLGSNKEE